MDRGHFRQDGREGVAGEDRLQRRADLGLPAGAQAVVLQLRNSVSTPSSQSCHWPRTSRTRASACCTRSSSSSAEGISPASSWRPAAGGRGRRRLQLVGQPDLVAQAQLDVDALDAVGVLRHPRSGITVLVDLEGVGVLAIAAVRLRSSQNFLRARGSPPRSPRRCASWRGAPLRGARATASGRRRRCRRPAPSWAGRRAWTWSVAHRLQVAVVQVFQAGQHGAGAALFGEHEVLDLDDAGHGVAGIAEEFQAHRARVAAACGAPPNARW